MTPNVLPDAMPDIRAYLRNHPYLANLTAGRVFFHLPDPTMQAPFIHMYRSGGGLSNPTSDSPLMDYRVAIVVWGNKGSDYPMVRSTVLAIESMAFLFASNAVLGPGGTHGKNISVTTSLDSPDPDSGSPRILMDTIWTVTV